jgi:hypothetical protein
VLLLLLLLLLLLVVVVVVVELVELVVVLVFEHVLLLLLLVPQQDPAGPTVYCCHTCGCLACCFLSLRFVKPPADLADLKVLGLLQGLHSIHKHLLFVRSQALKVQYKYLKKPLSETEIFATFPSCACS